MKKYTREELVNETLKYFNGDEMATDVWINKYALKDSEGNFYELTPDNMHRRIAKEIARMESKYPNPLLEDQIYNLLKNFKYIIPAGSPMSGIGNNEQIVSLSNCFVVGNEADSYGGIFMTDQEQAQLMKRRGGVGHDLTHIRPKKTKVNNSALTSTGVVPFMERFSNTTREVAQDGRRGALMLSISVDHPDSEDFIDAKMESGKITGANISVKISDNFMKSIIDGTKFIQQYPVGVDNPKVTKEADSKKIWSKIIHNAWKSAEPGVLFWDSIIRESVPDCYADLGFKTVSTNPCIIGNSIIAVADGRNGVSISQLTEEGKDIPIYSKNSEGKVEIKWGRNPRKTGSKREVWKLTLDDESEFIATPDHIMFLKNNSKIELKNLKPGDSLSSFYSFVSNERYRQISNCGSKMIGGNFRNRRQYRLIHEFYNNNNSIDYKNFALHHKDFDSYNDNILNLELMPMEEHTRLHSDRIKGSNNPYHRLTDEQKFTFASHPGEKNPKYINISNDELLKHGRKLYQEQGIITRKSWYEYAKMNNLPQFISNKFRFNSFTDFKNQIIDNHKVVKVEFFGFEDVYNITVDDNHNYIVLTSKEDDRYITSGGICVKNCGEIPLCVSDSCRLICLNLYSYIINPFTKESYFDFDLFKEHVRYAQRFMDDIIDLELEKIETILEKIKNDPEDDFIKLVETQLWLKIKDKTIRGRRTGVGITAEGDMLAALNIRYGTKKSTEFSEKVHKILAIEAYKSSCIMAKERGSFPIYDYNREIDNPFINRLKKDDLELDSMLKEGRRNIALLTCAPTGTVSILSQTTSGIEPAFATYYKRRRKINPSDRNAKSHFVDELGDHWEEYYVFHHKFLIWLEVNGYNVEEVKSMSDEELKEISEKSPYHKATSNDVDWVEKVRLQGSIQKYVDHSISVTINLPENITEDIVSKVYEEGWKSGCKGITVYREGSRAGVLVTAKKKDEKKDESDIRENNVPKRPEILEADVIRFKNKGEDWIGFTGLDKKGRPYEVFTGLAESFIVPKYVEKGKIKKIKGGDKDGNSRYDFIFTDKDGYEMTIPALNRAFNPEYWNIAKMTSAVLRHGMPIVSAIALLESLKLDGEYLGTWKAGVKRMLKKYIKDGEKPKNNVCPECGSDQIVFEQGCLTCKNCSWSKCSS